MPMNAQQLLYYKSPVAVQNALASFQGFLLERRRYGGKYPEYCEQIRNRKRWSSEQFREHQNRTFVELIRFIHDHARFYCKKWDDFGVDPNRITGIEDIHMIPFLAKEEVRLNHENMRAQSYSSSAEMVIQTTGTTGTPLPVYCDGRSRQLNYAFFNTYLESIGIDISLRKATIGGRVIVHPDQKESPFWRYSYPTKNLFLSSYHLQDENLKLFVEKLREFDPHWIDAYPSSIFTIAEFMLKTGLSACRPQAIVTSGETLFPEQRQVVEEAFGCKIFDQYGAAEMCVFAGQCRQGKYHLRPDYALVEFIQNDKPAPPGELAEIVCTGFVNWRMPLVRYRIGDLGMLSKETCSCGLNTPIIESLQGRMDDVVVSKTGRRIGRLSPVLKGFPVKEALYIQKKEGEIILQVVRGEEFKEDTVKAIISEVKARVGSDFEVVLQIVDGIERSAGAKTKSVISLIK
jgi:phenylacetate-CoA ligase